MTVSGHSRNQNMQIQNAVVRSTNLGVEDHGIMTAWLHLDYGGGGQGFGGWALDGAPAERGVGSKRTPTVYCGLFIARVLEVTGAASWEKLPGTSVRVQREDGFNGRIVGLGHYLRDEWFEPEAEFAAADQPTVTVRR